MRKDILKSADSSFHLGVVFRAGLNGAEGAATPGRKPTPARDRFERGDGTEKKPGQATVGTR